MKIKVPKTPKRAFNKERPASDLLKGQLQHLEWAVRPASKRSPKQMRRVKPPRTEGEAAQRVSVLMSQLHPEGTKTTPAAEMPAAQTTTTKQRRRRRSSKRRRSGRGGGK